MTNRIYIGRLSLKARERDVDKFFRPYGRIRDINLKNGFGFVEFDSAHDADDAVYSCNGRELLNERITVELAKGGSSYSGGNNNSSSNSHSMSSSSRGSHYSSSMNNNSYRGYYHSRGFLKYGPPMRTDFRIIIENLSSRVSWQDLKDFMRSAGRISYADAHRKKTGEGIVEFTCYEDMKNALRKLDGSELNGRKIRIYDGRSSIRRKSRSRSRSRERRRTRSRSRSRDRKSKSREQDVRKRRRSRSRASSYSASPSRSPYHRSRSYSRAKSGSRSRSPTRSRSRTHSEDPPNDRSSSHSQSSMKEESPAEENKN